MPIIRVPEDAWPGGAFDQLVPGSRVEYRGTSWKVVGMYFTPAQAAKTSNAGAGRQIELCVPERTRYVILKSLRLGPGALHYLHASRSP